MKCFSPAKRWVALISATFLFGSLPASAAIKQVTQLNASGSSVIVIPGSNAKLIIIQNNGSNDVRLSFDGGAGTVGSNQKYGTNPTPTTGYLLKAGQGITLTMTPYTGITPDPTLHKPIVAIMVTGTTTLDIVTDDTESVFPTN